MTEQTFPETSTQSSGPSGGRVRALDGIRAFAVILVIFGHSADGGGLTLSRSWQRALAPLLNSNLGVLAFFVLSGYLITGNLLRRRDRVGRIDLRDFYRKRILRIWPAFYVFLGAMALLTATHEISVSAGALVSAALFVLNYSPASASRWVSHTWSLAVEEQFYLLWPLALKLLKPKRALGGAVLVMLAEPLLRVAEYELLPGDRARIQVYFHTRADSLLMGCALALLPRVYPTAARRLTSIVTRSRLEVWAIVLLVVSSYMQFLGGGAWEFTVGWSLENLCVAVLILGVTARKESAIGRAFRVRIVVFVGIISYSVYLWQQPFTTTLNQSVTATFPLCALVILVVALASYLVIERPFLRLKDRRPRRSGSMDAQDLA